MNAKKFIQCLTLYGSDKTRWPQELRGEWAQAQQDPHSNRRIAEQQLFEEIFLNDRPVAPAHSDLAARIIRAARHIRPATTLPLSAWLGELLSLLLPRPAYALASVAMIGIAIGLSLPVASADGDGANNQTSYEEEAAL